MTWTAFKLAAKKAWVWTKNYWHIPALLIYTLVMWVMFRRDSAVILQVLNSARDSYESQIKVLNDTHEKEIQKRDEILKKYHDVLLNIEEEYKKNEETLNNEKKDRIKEIVEKYHDDSGELSKKLAERFGVTYVPK